MAVQLCGRFGIIQVVFTIQNSDLDNFHAWKSTAISVQGASAVTAEIASDLVVAVGYLCVDFGVASDLEALSWDNIVDAVGRSACLATIGTVAETLGDISMLQIEWKQVKLQP